MEILGGSRTESGKKIQAMDMLRVVGLFFVLAYHLYPSALRGGFVGVDIFFVCSGYLTTALMINEFKTSGGVRLGAFYLRRIKRLLPALAGAVLFGLTLSLLISPDFRVGIGRQALAALGAFTNYYEISTGSSYERQLLPHMFVHTWALAAEIQFYAIWGAVIAAAAWFGRRTSRPGLASKTVLGAACVLGALSYGVMRLYFRDFVSGGDPARAYYAFESRAFSLLVGAAAGAAAGIDLPGRLKKLAARRWFVPAAYALSALSLAGLAALSVLLRYNEPETYRYGLLLAAGLAAFTAALARTAGIPNLRGKPLAVAEYLSSRSYGIYLYHWPLHVVVRQILPAAAAVAPVTTALSFLAAEASYRFIERRFRRLSFKDFRSKSREISEKSAAVSEDAAARPENAPRAQLSARRLAVSALAMILLAASAYSVASSPRKTSIQLDLEAEADRAARIMSKARDAMAEADAEDGAATEADTQNGYAKSSGLNGNSGDSGDSSDSSDSSQNKSSGSIAGLLGDSSDSSDSSDSGDSGDSGDSSDSSQDKTGGSLAGQSGNSSDSSGSSGSGDSSPDKTGGSLVGPSENSSDSSGSGDSSQDKSGGSLAGPSGDSSGSSGSSPDKSGGSIAGPSGDSGDSSGSSPDKSGGSLAGPSGNSSDSSGSSPDNSGGSLAGPSGNSSDSGGSSDFSQDKSGGSLAGPPGNSSGSSGSSDSSQDKSGLLAGTSVQAAPKRVLVIGDSVTLGAATAILETIPGSVVDAEESRDIRAGLTLLADYADKGELGDVIVVALLENNLNRKTDQRAEEIVQTYGNDRKIVFVTGFGKSDMKSAADFVRALPGVYPNVAVADWAEAAALHTDWLYSDKTHIKSPEGKRMYADLIAEAIKGLYRNEAVGAEETDGTANPAGTPPPAAGKGERPSGGLRLFREY